MALKQRFRKGTKGYNGEVFVIPNVAYTAATTLALFAALTTNAGQVGVFNAGTNALITTPLTEGQEFYIAQLRANGGGTGFTVKKSSPFVYSKKGVLAIDPVAPVKHAYTLTLPGYTPVKGDTIAIKVIETADESHRPPHNDFVYTVKAGDTLQKIYEGLRDDILKHPEAYGTQDDVFVTATASAAGLVVTHKFDQAVFKLATPGIAYDYASIAETKAVFGSGFYDEVAQLEYEGEVFEGVTTQYPGGDFIPSDFNTPPRFAVEGINYAKIQLNSYKDEYSPTPVNKHHHLKHLVLVAVDGSGAHNELEEIFGLVAPGG